MKVYIVEWDWNPGRAEFHVVVAKDEDAAYDLARAEDASEVCAPGRIIEIREVNLEKAGVVATASYCGNCP